MNTTFNVPDRRWLVVDDESLLVEITALILDQIGTRSVQSFDSAPEALETFSARPQEFELVVTDRDMPGLDGVELARRIHRQAPKTKIILLTGNLDGLTAEVLDTAGICAVVPKPYTIDRLQALVRGMTCEAATVQHQTRCQPAAAA
jgi:two-component system, cell cycle sensor histidine kinase and response regulator CckA